MNITEQINTTNKRTFKHKVVAGQEGVYGLIFVRCSPEMGSVSFTLDVDFYNPGPDYLGTGLSPLPTIYFTLSIAYAAGLVAFAMNTIQNHIYALKIHIVMAISCFWKILSLFFESVTMHFVKIQGQPVGWNWLYYIFTTLTGVGFFLSIILLGLGWNIMRVSFLSLNDGTENTYLLWNLC